MPSTVGVLPLGVRTPDGAGVCGADVGALSEAATGGAIGDVVAVVTGGNVNEAPHPARQRQDNTAKNNGRAAAGACNMPL